LTATSRRPNGMPRSRRVATGLLPWTATAVTTLVVNAKPSAWFRPPSLTQNSASIGPRFSRETGHPPPGTTVIHQPAAPPLTIGKSNTSLPAHLATTTLADDDPHPDRTTTPAQATITSAHLAPSDLQREASTRAHGLRKFMVIVLPFTGDVGSSFTR